MAYTLEFVATTRYHTFNLTKRTPPVELAGDALSVVRKMYGARAELGLSEVEVEATRQAVAEHEYVYLHAAAGAGVAAYLRVVGELARSGSLRWLGHPRGLLRALYRSSFRTQRRARPTGA